MKIFIYKGYKELFGDIALDYFKLQNNNIMELSLNTIIDDKNDETYVNHIRDYVKENVMNDSYNIKIDGLYLLILKVLVQKLLYKIFPELKNQVFENFDNIMKEKENFLIKNNLTLTFNNDINR